MRVKRDAGFSAPINKIIKTAVTEAIAKTSLSFDSYTAAFVDHYVSTVAEADREFEVKQTGDAYRDVVNNSRKLGRYFSPEKEGILRLPTVCIPSLIAALPEPWRGNVQTAVCELIKPTQLESAQGDAYAAAIDIVKEHGEALNAYLLVAKDGLKNDADADLIAARVQLLQSVEAAQHAIAMIDDELKSRRTINAVGAA
jgi:hypothetical protein